MSIGERARQAAAKKAARRQFRLERKEPAKEALAPPPDDGIPF